MVLAAANIIFLPLAFFTSYFEMNLPDIGKKYDSKYLFLGAGPTSGSAVIASFANLKAPERHEAALSTLGKALTGSADLDIEPSWWS